MAADARIAPSLERRRWLALLGALLLTVGCGGSPPADLGEVGAKLRACSPPPNCVSSDAPDAKHHVAPIEIVGPPDAAFAKAKEIVEGWSRTKIDRAEPTYLHAESASLIFRFTDDMELSLRPEQGIIAVRSASRRGYSDFGVNRRRVERLRKAMVEAGVAKPASEEAGPPAAAA